ncbi:ketopantoate reductase family protein [Nocardia sp. alder85J]|uniref:ketopantoate reductase family protein n=1 Tax=Nocardia sp. alder85J TaxID=2862949 RepID=UPI001CD253A0|nr:2-dehydropantoate 2-reductase N-terminal domain-containing protein [Nocardia sp. alder85J]MCX4090996.1 ketopantoate reductase family protein [Nocardia sp. alder85J]
MTPATIPPPRLRIAVIGPGGIGSTFAFQLSRAGHDVTVVARGARLECLRRDRAIVTTTGEHAAVHVAEVLDTTVSWDLVLVTVLVSETDVLLPRLADCAADAIMFMFNTFQPLDHLRDAVGAHRTVFGFPAVVASIRDGRLESDILRRGVASTVSEKRWATVFSDAGIPAAAHPDMQSWLRTHAAFIVPVLLAGLSAHRSGHGVDRREATVLAHALREGLGLVRRLGNTVTPGPIGVLGRLPVPMIATLLWMATRIPAFIRTSSVAPPDEPAVLIDEMISLAPQDIPALRAVRPR